MTIKVGVPLFGTYESDNDLYQAALGRDRGELLDRVREEVTESEYLHTVLALLDCELAGMVAEWETGARTNERQAEQAALHVRPARADTRAAYRTDPPALVRAEVEAVARETVFSVSDLTSAMRRALLDEHASGQTAAALERRGLARRGSSRHGRWLLDLTDAGRRSAEALRAEMDAAPVVPVDEEPMNDLEVEQLTGRPAPEPCGRRWVAEIELCPRCGHDAAAHADRPIGEFRFSGPVEDQGARVHPYVFGVLRESVRMLIAETVDLDFVRAALEHCEETLAASGYGTREG